MNIQRKHPERKEETEKVKEISQKNSCLRRGFVAGFLGGLAGSAAKVAAEALYPPRIKGQTPPPVVLIRKLNQAPLTKQAENAAMQAIHYTFGALTGGVYGALAEFYPVVTTASGAGLGLALQGLTHESLVPALGLSDPPWKQTSREHLSEAVTHIAYGVTTEVVRSYLRRSLLR